MLDETSGQEVGKPRRRQAVKTSKLLASSKVKTTVSLSVEASQRLTVHAAMMGIDRSALMEKLIGDHLRRWVVSDRGGHDSEATG